MSGKAEGPNSLGGLRADQLPNGHAPRSFTCTRPTKKPPCLERPRRRVVGSYVGAERPRRRVFGSYVGARSPVARAFHSSRSTGIGGCESIQHVSGFIVGLSHRLAIASLVLGQEQQHTLGELRAVLQQGMSQLAEQAGSAAGSAGASG